MLKSITDKVLYMNYDDDLARPSLGLIIGEKYSLLVDAGNSEEHIKEFKRLIENKKIDNLKYLAITHHHWDHVYGINMLGLVSIASTRTCEILKEKDKKIDIGVETKANINLGDIEITIEYVGGDHVDDSSIIYIGKEKVMFLGDSIYRGWDEKSGRRYHSLENIKRLYSTMISYDCNWYISSHKKVYSRVEFKNLFKRMIDLGEMVEKNEQLDYKDKSFSKEDRFFLRAFMENLKSK